MQLTMIFLLVQFLGFNPAHYGFLLNQLIIGFNPAHYGFSP